LTVEAKVSSPTSGVPIVAGAALSGSRHPAVQQWIRTAAVMLALFAPLGLAVLWLASTEREVHTPLVWNSEAQAVCVQGEPCNTGVVAIRAAAGDAQGNTAQRQLLPDVPVDADLLLSAGHFLPTHAQRDDYYARHRLLNALLQADTVQLVLAGGGTRDVGVSDRGFGGIEAMLWLHVLFAALAWTSGLTHAVMRPQMGSYFLGLSCVGYAVGMVLGGLELVHGVAWPLGGAQWINGAARGAVQFAFAGYLGFVLCLPQRFAPLRMLRVLPLLALGVVCIDQFRLAPAPFWGHQAFMVVWCLMVPVALVYQWRRTHSPLLRALVQWFGLGALLLALRFALIYVMSDSAVEEKEFFVAASFLAVKTYSLVVMLASPALSLADNAFKRVFLWVLAGLLLVVSDVLLVLLLSVHQQVALMASLLLVGSLYLPLRGWVFERLLGRAPLRLEDHIDALYATARAVGQPGDAAERAWSALMQQVFEPEQVAPSAYQTAQSQVLDDGAGLWAPLPAAGLGLVVRHAQAGRRLFGPGDTRFVNHCAAILQRLVDSDRAAEQARQEERQRIANDLHDDLGGRLLHLAQARHTDDWSRYAQETLAEMRLITHGMVREATALADLLADLRGDLVPRILRSGTRAQWHVDVGGVGEGGQTLVRPEAALGLARILSEALRNALSHGQVPLGGQVEVLVSWSGGDLLVQVANDGPSVNPDIWTLGLGVRSIERRAVRLGGQAQWTARGEGGVLLTVRIPHKKLSQGGHE
jgi:signal transduction histidine kinase